MDAGLYGVVFFKVYEYIRKLNKLWMGKKKICIDGPQGVCFAEFFMSISDISFARRKSTINLNKSKEQLMGVLSCR